MGLYWPEARTALFIIDDPSRDDIEDEEECEVAVISLSSDSDLDRFLELASSFAWLLGENDPDEPDPDRWERRRRTRALLRLNDMSQFKRLI